MNHYELLEVSRQASPEVIEAAYKALLKKHHPDRGHTKGVTALRLGDAYSTLTSPRSKARYDAEIDEVKGKRIGDFTVERAIAEGGFGKTYFGRHVLTGMPVCIKHCSRISAADAEVLINEAKAMWDLRHFAIPTVRTLFKLDDGSLALIMSFVEGPTLEQVVEKRKEKSKILEPEHVAWILARLVNGLSYIHRHGVVHGDLKPANVVIQPESHMAVLVDFGLSAIKPKADGKSTGYTEVFAPPEQVDGNKPPIPQTDFYALGMTAIYALANGDMHLTEGKRIPTHVPEPMKRFIGRLVTRDPLSRPDWKTEDLNTTVETMRRESFGRSMSGFLPLEL